MPIEHAAEPSVRFEPTTADLDDDRTPVRLEFVEVRSAPVTSRRRGATKGVPRDGAQVVSAVTTTPNQATTEVALTAGPADPRWSLWGETDT